MAVYNLMLVAPSLGLLLARLAFGEQQRKSFEGWAERLDAASRPAAA